MKTVMRKAMLPVVALAGFGGGMLATGANADQPYMHQALDQLAATRATLQQGTTDKGGHRVRAIALVNRAMVEVRAGIDYDRAHGY